ncbi:hypothetical protein PROFUN_07413 [Planoprotostelium fungivorum]|uniref:HEAT repeat domain-containing protein n=1 Tax=Planoprotostelium fungivorum TaxID=1890364 RepID=A0A2P6MTJ0_9EUKA|nr:hypothetical protein PROFUN_07413 [Planoprotostelium fungivorum]
MTRFKEKVIATFSHLSLDDDTLNYIVFMLEGMTDPSEVAEVLPTLLADHCDEAEAKRLSRQLVRSLPEPDRKDEACIAPSPASSVIQDFIEATRAVNPMDRKAALRELCPCHVLRNVPEFWDRIIDMANDPDARVRYQVLHNLCDGSPKDREEDVIETIERMHNDENKLIRRRVHQVNGAIIIIQLKKNQVLTHYRYTGKWNIL